MSDKWGNVFRQWAERVAAIPDEEFAGAVVIVDPDGNTIEYLITDSKKDTAFFWLGLKARIETEFARLQDEQRKTQTGGWR